jgi:hypothetical protein
MGDGSNITLPHRPAAFPNHLSPPTILPISGYLKSFASLTNQSQNQADILIPSVEQACIHTVSDRYFPPQKPYSIALVERGGCDFATKVKATQARGVAGVIVGDGVARLGESDEEGRTRDSLITMFSPGKFRLSTCPRHCI